MGIRRESAWIGSFANRSCQQALQAPQAPGALVPACLLVELEAGTSIAWM